MKNIIVTPEGLAEIIKVESKFVLLWGADWHSSSCRMKKKLESYDNVYYVDIDDKNGFIMAQHMNIQKLPTLEVRNGGVTRYERELSVDELAEIMEPFL
jgi:hypothetical protein